MFSTKMESRTFYFVLKMTLSMNMVYKHQRISLCIHLSVSMKHMKTKLDLYKENWRDCNQWNHQWQYTLLCQSNSILFDYFQFWNSTVYPRHHFCNNREWNFSRQYSIELQSHFSLYSNKTTWNPVKRTWRSGHCLINLDISYLNCHI